MDISEFISPLETVQVLSVFNYINILSDFLYTEQYLDKNDQHKRIPIVNALYHYLLIDKNNKNIQRRKVYLTKKLINGTDLYGAKENETPDLYFIETLFTHIINSLVFDRFVNIFGFIANCIQYTRDDSLINLQHYIKKVLISLTFENEYGDDSELIPLAVDTIFNDLIVPLFPQPTIYPINVTSVDYIYAMAGNMFLRSKETNLFDKYLNIRGKVDERKYQEYIEIGHVIEQLVLAEKVDKLALRIFALPALINYVYKERKNLESIQEIVNSEHHWQEAYRHLFTYLNNSFSVMEKIQDNNYRYQFYSAMSNFKNRSTLAREIIEMNCIEISEMVMKSEIIRYENNPQNYKCLFPYNDNPLDDLNFLYQETISNITKKYYIYELESSRSVFGNNFINQIDNTTVIVSKGLFRYFYYGGLGITADPVQMINASHDLLQFYYPKIEKYEYYALVRHKYNVSLIKEADNPKLFRKTLELDENEILRSNQFPTILKSEEEKFENILKKIATERADVFHKSLESGGYDETQQEWWINFSKSLIPFYSCIKNIKKQNLQEASFLCPLDVLFFIPVAGEIGNIAGKTLSTVGRGFLMITETTLRTLTIRTSIKTLLRVTGKTIVEELSRFGELFTRETFQNLGISLLRFIDPGFELAFTIGSRGLRCIKALVLQAERRLSTESQFLREQLFRAEYTLSHYSQRVDQIFKKDVYVNTILGVNSGYGYKYILANGRVAEIRTVYPSLEIPLVRQTEKTNQFKPVKKYSKIDLNTGELIPETYFEDQEGIILSEEKTFEFNFVSLESSLSEGPNLSCDGKCPKSHKERFAEALNYAQGKISQEVVQEELKKYAFPIKEKTELDFVSDWIKNKELPNWAENYKIEEAEIFYDLRNREVFDNIQLTRIEARQRIESIYPPEYEYYGSAGIRAEFITTDFIKKKAYKLQAFEDYFAIRNYCSAGYKRITANTNEARQMKNAIYRLAIRQSEDFIHDYAKVLFRGENRVSESIDKLFVPGEELIFHRFTSTTRKLEAALAFTGSSRYPFRKVVYEMEFSQPYLRANVEDLSPLEEYESILLPGTKFQIREVIYESGNQNYVIVKLKHKHELITKAEWQMQVMNEIKKLKDTQTLFYAKDTDTYRTSIL
ncbi:uncharacterized protein LOC127277492 [Leptopilina boulardi]|uniref:uncharacterized protein LOC127277492 n=1 Tax=Leptopilina boulardi TaxID=63433 RepID=UPI0021F64465|nr:uncharacterized protein LOC127277492 [Leptopilina boulardi]